MILSLRWARITSVLLTSVVDDLGAQDSGHLQHSDEGLVHGGEGEGGHAVPPGHLGDVHCTVTWNDRLETLSCMSWLSSLTISHSHTSVS